MKDNTSYNTQSPAPEVIPPNHFKVKAHTFADARDKDSIERGYSNRRGMDDSMAKIYSIRGNMGEAAFCFYMGKEYDPKPNQVGKPDYIAADGSEWNIKTNRNPEELTIPQKDIERGHNIIWITELGNGAYRINGFISNKAVRRFPLKNPKERHDKKTGAPALAYVIPISFFKPILITGRN